MQIVSTICMKCQSLFPGKTFCAIVSLGDIQHEMSKPIFWENKKNIINLSSAENFTKSAKH